MQDLNQTWKRLVAAGTLLVLLLVGWDLFLLVSGAKNEFNYSLVPISPLLYGNVEEHLRDGETFVDFEEQALFEEGF